MPDTIMRGDAKSIQSINIMKNFFSNLFLWLLTLWTMALRVCVTLMVLLFLAAFNVKAQTNNPLAPPSTPPTSVDLTNSPLAPLNALGSILPYWDSTLTNSFSSNEFFIDVVPLWKSQTASGSSPYLSTEAGYFFTKNLGASGELVSFGDGAGATVLDSAAILGQVRFDSGNVAGRLMLGPSYELPHHAFGADLGGGVDLRYQTGIDFFVDTRYRFEFGSTGIDGWLTRVGLRLNFRSH